MPDQPLKYWSKPQVVEAMQYDGTAYSAGQIVEWVRASGEQCDGVPSKRYTPIYIVTDTGIVQVWTDWYLVKTGPHAFEAWPEENFYEQYSITKP